MLRKNRTATVWKLSLKRPVTGGESRKARFFFNVREGIRQAKMLAFLFAAARELAKPQSVFWLDP